MPWQRRTSSHSTSRIEPRPQSVEKSLFQFRYEPGADVI
jgi:hypothetical protein